MKYTVIDENGNVANMILVAPRPYPSWTLDVNNEWQPPTSQPTENKDKWSWNEETQAWETYD